MRPGWTVGINSPSPPSPNHGPQLSSKKCQPCVRKVRIGGKHTCVRVAHGCTRTEPWLMCVCNHALVSLTSQGALENPRAWWGRTACSCAACCPVGSPCCLEQGGQVGTHRPQQTHLGQSLRFQAERNWPAGWPVNSPGRCTPASLHRGLPQPWPSSLCWGLPP